MYFKLIGRIHWRWGNNYSHNPVAIFIVKHSQMIAGIADESNFHEVVALRRGRKGIPLLGVRIADVVITLRKHGCAA